jgi:hypothetical protein
VAGGNADQVANPGADIPAGGIGNKTIEHQAA